MSDAIVPSSGVVTYHPKTAWSTVFAHTRSLPRSAPSPPPLARCPAAVFAIGGPTLVIRSSGHS